jgi:hypothetical protein
MAEHDRCQSIFLNLLQVKGLHTESAPAYIREFFVLPPNTNLKLGQVKIRDGRLLEGSISGSTYPFCCLLVCWFVGIIKKLKALPVQQFSLLSD